MCIRHLMTANLLTSNAQFSRWYAVTLVCILAMSALGIVRLYRTEPQPRARVTPPINNPHGIAWWHWHRSTTLAPADCATLISMPCDRIAEWSGEINYDPANGLIFHDRGGRVRGMPSIPRSAVIRLEASCLVALTNHQLGQDLCFVIAQHIDERDLQLDWDVPESQLAAYAEWLGQLRHHLRPAQQVSATGLVSWLKQTEAQAVADQLDELFMQFYHLRVPTLDDRAVHTAYNPLDYVERLEALACPYRIGLATFDTTSAFDENGHCVAASLPISFEDLVRQDALPISSTHELEFVNVFQLRQAARLDGIPFAAGTRFLIARTDPQWLTSIRQQLLSRTLHHCAGIALFRLPAPGSQPCLSIQQVDHALTDTLTPAEVSTDLTPTAQGLELSLRNLGDYAIAPHTVMLRISCLPQSIQTSALPPGSSISAGYNGRVVSPLRANESIITLGYLRAGSSWSIPINDAQARVIAMSPLLGQLPAQEGSP